MQEVVPDNDRMWLFSIMSVVPMKTDRCAAPHSGVPAPLGRYKGRKDPLGTRNAKSE